MKQSQGTVLSREHDSGGIIKDTADLASFAITHGAISALVRSRVSSIVRRGVRIIETIKHTARTSGAVVERRVYAVIRCGKDFKGHPSVDCVSFNAVYTQAHPWKLFSRESVSTLPPARRLHVPEAIVFFIVIEDLFTITEFIRLLF